MSTLGILEMQIESKMIKPLRSIRNVGRVESQGGLKGAGR